MSVNLPVNLENDIRLYAQTEHLSVDEAAAQLIQAGLKTAKRMARSPGLVESDWSKLRELDPGFKFFESMPDTLLDNIETAGKRSRSERLKSRA